MSLTAAHLDSFLSAGLTAEQIVALVKTDIQERERVSDQRRAKDRDRQKRHRESRGVTRTNAESPKSQRHPPKDNKSNPPCSEANASGGSPPADPMKELFDVGVSILTAAGQTEKQARSLVGKWRKQGDAKVLAAFLECRSKAISNPVEWLTKRLAAAKWVSKSGYEYRGSDEDVMREAERRNDMDTYWRVKGVLKHAA